MQVYEGIASIRTTSRVNLCCPPRQGHFSAGENLNMFAKPAASLNWVVELFLPSERFATRDLWMNVVYHDISMICQPYLTSSGLFEIFFIKTPFMMAFLLLVLNPYFLYWHHDRRKSPFQNQFNQCLWIRIFESLGFGFKVNAFCISSTKSSLISPKLSARISK